MKKTTGTRTATTFTFRPSFMRRTPESDALIKTAYVWPSADKAQETVDRMIGSGYDHTISAAPGLTVYAFYAGGEMINCIVFEDATAARVHSAVRRQRPVTISYVTGEGEETVRTIEPRSVQTTKNGDLIVKALDRKSELHRTFRLDRVTAYTVHRTRFLVAEPVRTTDPETGRPVTLSARENAAQVLRASKPVPVVTDIYSTDPETAAAMEAPEAVQHLIAERYALGHLFAFVSA